MKFIIHGNPIAQKRPRIVNRGKFVRCYNPNSTDKIIVQDFLKKVMLERMFGKNEKDREEATLLAQPGTFIVTLCFYIPLPKSISQGQKNRLLWGFSSPHSKDLDNLAKFILDCGNTILYPDDRMISSLKIEEFYSLTPRTEVVVEKKDDVLDTAEIDKILACISPAELGQLYHDLMSVLDILQPCHVNPELYEKNRKEYLTSIAIVLSKIADKYAVQLKKINKTCPGYWKKEPPMAGRPLC